jgi:UDP-N-acetylmuramoyl-tripeptide--D-alanyl-D-alanine ligase
MKFGNTMAIADCYNANPSSMEASIRNFLQIDKANKVMILGDMLELGDDAESEHQKIADLVTQSGVGDVFWVGKNFYNSTHPNIAMKYLNVDDLIKNMEKHYFDGKFILIKGSRGIKLEKVLEILK